MQGVRTVKNVELIEVTVEELGGALPVGGTEICFRDVHYVIIEATPPKVRSSRWKARQTG